MRSCILLFTLSVAQLLANPIREHLIVSVTDDSLFPVYLLSASTLKREVNHPRFLGDSNSPLFVTLSVTSPCEVIVEIKCDKYIQQSSIQVRLNTAGAWAVSPMLRVNTDALYSLAEPETVIVDYAIRDASTKDLLASNQKRMRLRSINDCLFGFLDSRGEYKFKGIFFAAYVNENHPDIVRYLQHALQNRFIDSFTGYQGDKQSVIRQVDAVWKTLQRQGIKYSNITTVSDSSRRVFSQHVRMIDESWHNTQANCVDGTVLMASILRKIGLRTYLIFIPGHCFLGVSISDNDQDIIPIETTVIGNGVSLQRAVESGLSNYLPAKEKLNRVPGFQQISVNDARARGIMPLRSSQRSN